MSMYWPGNLDLSDTQSPKEILKAAQKDWETESGGVLTLVCQGAKTTSGETMLIVHAKHIPTGRTTTLFSVIHRADAPYPATIQLEDDKLPAFLQKSYYQPGFDDMALRIGAARGHQVTNKWVSDTPSEFRTKLSEAINLGVVKSRILSLVGNEPVAENAETGETPEGEAKES